MWLNIIQRETKFKTIGVDIQDGYSPESMRLSNGASWLSKPLVPEMD